MAKTSDIILLCVLIVLTISMSSVLIAALSSRGESSVNSQGELRVTELSDHALIITEDEDSEEEDKEMEIQVTGTALEKASAAALAYIGEGRVTDSEVGDEEGSYEIEITLDNGDEVDVHLDEEFNVLSTDEDEDDD